jgi:hypothetical protein
VNIRFEKRRGGTKNHQEIVDKEEGSAGKLLYRAEISRTRARSMPPPPHLTEGWREGGESDRNFFIRIMPEKGVSLQRNRKRQTFLSH